MIILISYLEFKGQDLSETSLSLIIAIVTLGYKN